MTTFEMLQELLAQNEFELLLPEDYTANTTEQDIRLVYQMNDTVESFLVFRKAIFTGTYKKDYEGKQRVYELRVITLENTINKQNAQLQSLAKQLNTTLQQAQDLAVKALEGSANASSFAAMKEIALEQAKTAQKAK